MPAGSRPFTPHTSCLPVWNKVQEQVQWHFQKGIAAQAYQTKQSLLPDMRTRLILTLLSKIPVT